MDENLDFLNRARITLSELIIQVGFDYLAAYPEVDVEEFVDTFFPPRDDIVGILKKEQIRLFRTSQKKCLMKTTENNHKKDASIRKLGRNHSDSQLIHFSSNDFHFLLILDSSAVSNSNSKMSLYPSLEDMKVDQTIRAQKQAFDAIAQQHQLMSQHQANAYPNLAIPSAPPMGSSPLQSPVYPDLVDYMGLELSQDVIAQNMPEYLKNGNTQQLTTYVPPSMPNNMVAPLSGSSVGLARAGTTNGIRELILCKDGKGKVGLRAQAINKGVFVCVVVKDSPAAMAGLRFGDQILQINGTTVAGFSVDDVHKLLKKSSHNNISVVIRDRPFERTVTLHKDSSNCVGFQFKNGKITSIVKDSSAARNGLLIEHQLLEVDGQNVVSWQYRR